MDGLSRTLAGRLAVVGGVLALIGNLLHPRFDQDENVDVYRAVAKSSTLVPPNLILILAFLATIVGVASIGASLYAGPGRDLARLGSAAAIVGGTIALANIGIETFAFRQLA